MNNEQLLTLTDHSQEITKYMGNRTIIIIIIIIIIKTQYLSAY